jgi:hypothetical protein
VRQSGRIREIRKTTTTKRKIPNSYKTELTVPGSHTTARAQTSASEQDMLRIIHTHMGKSDIYIEKSDEQKVHRQQEDHSRIEFCEKSRLWASLVF